MGNSDSDFEQQECCCDWEYLPELTLFIALSKLDDPSSLVRFGAVSRHWHSVFNTFLDIRRRSSQNIVPMLLIPTKKNKSKGKLYSLQAKAKVSTIDLAEPYDKRYCGSNYGWLATVDEDMVITLSNPFKKGGSNNINIIHLPRLVSDDRAPVGYQYDIHKVLLSADPSLNPMNGYVVAVMYTVYQRLAFYISRENSWIYVDQDLTLVCDVIFVRNFVYIIGSYSNFVLLDLNDITENCANMSPKLKILEPKDRFYYSDKIYLVQSSKGYLLSIHKHLDFEESYVGAHFTKKFRIFKWVLDDQTGELLEKEEVMSLDGDIVFIGDNKILAISALDFPQGQSDSIYYTDDYFKITPYEPFGPRDIGIFNLKDGSFEQHCPFKTSHKHLPPYIWILPVKFSPNLSNKS